MIATPPCQRPPNSSRASNIRRSALRLPDSRRGTGVPPGSQQEYYNKCDYDKSHIAAGDCRTDVPERKGPQVTAPRRPPSHAGAGWTSARTSAPRPRTASAKAWPSCASAPVLVAERANRSGDAIILRHGNCLLPDGVTAIQDTSCTSTMYHGTGGGRIVVTTKPLPVGFCFSRRRSCLL